MEKLMTAEEAVEQSQDKSRGIVGFWTFLGLALLFAIPVIGWIACVVFMFAPKCRSLKNYARATMAKMLIGLLITVLLVSALISLVGGILLPYINDATGMEFESIDEIVTTVVMLQKGDYSGLLGLHKDKLIKLVGEEYIPMIEELGNGDYNELFAQLQEGDYVQILQDVKSGEYEQLMETVDEDVYDEVVGELQKAADGEYSTVLEELKNYIPSF